MRLILPFIALPYIIRTIGSEKYGTVVFIQTIVSYFVIFINFGLDISAVKDVAINRYDKIKLNEIVSSVLIIKGVLLVVSLFVFFAGVLFIPYLRTERLLFSFAFLTCFSEILFPIWFYQGIEKMQYMAIIRFISILFYTATIFIFVRIPADYTNVALLQSLGTLLSGIVSFYVLLRVEHIKLLLPPVTTLKSCFVNSIPFFTSRLSVVINNGMAKLISGMFLSMHTVAVFDLAQKLSTAFLMPMQMSNQAVYPHIAHTRQQGFVRKYFKLNIVLSFSVAVSLFFCAPLLVKFFAGNQMPESVAVVRILCFWVCFGGITGYIGSPLLVSYGYAKEFNYSVILSTLFLALAYFLLYMIGIFTVFIFAWVLVLSELLILLYRLYYCYHYKIF
jgi:PST family polysaccharide transporter